MLKVAFDLGVHLGATVVALDGRGGGRAAPFGCLTLCTLTLLALLFVPAFLQFSPALFLVPTLFGFTLVALASLLLLGPISMVGLTTIGRRLRWRSVLRRGDIFVGRSLFRSG